MAKKALRIWGEALSERRKPEGQAQISFRSLRGPHRQHIVVQTCISSIKPDTVELGAGNDRFI